MQKTETFSLEHLSFHVFGIVMNTLSCEQMNKRVWFNE